MSAIKDFIASDWLFCLKIYVDWHVKFLVMQAPDKARYAVILHWWLSIQILHACYLFIAHDMQLTHQFIISVIT